MSIFAWLVMRRLGSTALCFIEVSFLKALGELQHKFNPVVDGEWQQCIVDDKLYLRAADYDESIDERPIWDDINRNDTEEEYRKVWQTGSRALYFARCADENETWLPLLEKAYAKAHGDYSAIEGGFVG